MGNSKSFSVAEKHRRKRRAAKEQVSQFMHTKGADASKLSALAQKMLQRRLRLGKS